MRAIAGLWRWRHNPLRRGTDRVEAWVALVALLLLVVAVPLAGILSGVLTGNALQRAVRDQRAARQQITATVVREVRQPPLDPDPETATRRDAHSRVLAAWTAPDGTSHSGTVVADLKSPHAGDPFKLWTDRHGRIVGRPLDSPTATTHAALAGLGAAAATTGLVEGARRLIVWRLIRRRYARWDQAWAQAGPDWGRTGTGS
ncbi:Rv1733c family protein [Actinomycetota bacterium Odt1-20B]